MFAREQFTIRKVPNDHGYVQYAHPHPYTLAGSAFARLALDIRTRMGARPSSEQSKMATATFAELVSAVSVTAAESLADRVKGCLFGLLIADALAMPSHWFYGGERQIISMYGHRLSGYEQPITKLPGSIMSLSNTGGAGRGGSKGTIIGDVIFHGKKKYWERGGNFHYHQGMAAGDNTLEALLMRRVVNVTAASAGGTEGATFNPERILEDYIQFMTTPNTHNDTYCGTSHRMFFKNYAAGKNPKECPDNDNHNVDSADSIVTTVPVALISSDERVARNQAGEMVALTRNSKTARQHAAVFASTLRAVVQGVSVRDAVLVASGIVGYDVKAAVERTGRRDENANKEASRRAFRQGVLENANRGGENVATGALIGALLGAECGYSNLPPDLLDGLARSQREQIDREIEAFASAVPFSRNNNNMERGSSGTSL